MDSLVTQLADIVPPSAPPPLRQHPESLLPLVLALLAAAIVVGAAARWVRTRKRRETAARLQRWEHALDDGCLEGRELAYLLAIDLRALLDVARLDCATPPAFAGAEEEAAWRDFMARLDSLRYQPQPATEQADARRLLADAQHWHRRMR